MKHIADEISESLKHSTCLKADETTILIEKKRGYVWACIGDMHINYCGTNSWRFSAQRILSSLGHTITCDGYTAYNKFCIRQRAGLTYHVKQMILHRKMIWNADYYTRDCRNCFILQNVLPPTLTRRK